MELACGGRLVSFKRAQEPDETWIAGGLRRRLDKSAPTLRRGEEHDRRVSDLRDQLDDLELDMPSTIDEEELSVAEISDDEVWELRTSPVPRPQLLQVISSNVYDDYDDDFESDDDEEGMLHLSDNVFENENDNESGNEGASDNDFPTPQPKQEVLVPSAHGPTWTFTPLPPSPPCMFFSIPPQSPCMSVPTPPKPACMSLVDTAATSETLHTEVSFTPSLSPKKTSKRRRKSWVKRLRNLFLFKCCCLSVASE